MDIVIDLNLLEEHKLTPDLYALLMCINLEIPYRLASAETQAEFVKYLEEQGWCKNTSTGPILRQKALKLINVTDTSPDNVESWVEEWRDLFPKGVQSGGRRVRGDKQGVLKKMKAFCKNYPQFKKKDIFIATKLYVFEKSRDRYNFMQCADYFIDKNGVSALASIIEDLDGKESPLELINKGGGSTFHKEI